MSSNNHSVIKGIQRWSFRLYVPCHFDQHNLYIFICCPEEQEHLEQESLSFGWRAAPAQHRLLLQLDVQSAINPPCQALTRTTIFTFFTEITRDFDKCSAGSRGLISRGSLTGLSGSHNIEGGVFSNPPLVGPGNLSFFLLFFFIFFFRFNFRHFNNMSWDLTNLGIEIGIDSSMNQLILKSSWVWGVSLWALSLPSNLLPLTSLFFFSCLYMYLHTWNWKILDKQKNRETSM